MRLPFPLGGNLDVEGVRLRNDSVAEEVVLLGSEGDPVDAPSEAMDLDLEPDLSRLEGTRVRVEVPGTAAARRARRW
jgi:hypothetical protein